MSVIISVSCWLLLQRYEKRHNHHTCGGLIFTREACNTPCSQRHGICRCHRPYTPPPQSIYPTEPAYICPQSLRESPCARRFIASILPPKSPPKNTRVSPSQDPGLSIANTRVSATPDPGINRKRGGHTPGTAPLGTRNIVGNIQNYLIVHIAVTFLSTVFGKRTTFFNILGKAIICPPEVMFLCGIVAAKLTPSKVLSLFLLTAGTYVASGPLDTKGKHQVHILMTIE